MIKMKAYDCLQCHLDLTWLLIIMNYKCRLIWKKIKQEILKLMMLCMSLSKSDEKIIETKDKNEKVEISVVKYIFAFKSLIPKSQTKEAQVWVTNECGAKIYKMKQSTTRIELFLEPISLQNQSAKNNNNVSNSAQKQQEGERFIMAQVCMGVVNGKFKIRYSNKVDIQIPIIIVNPKK